VQLYPKGGFSVAGVNNRLADKATDYWAKPVAIKAAEKNSNKLLFNSIETVHDRHGYVCFKHEKSRGIFFSVEGLNWQHWYVVF